MSGGRRAAAFTLIELLAVVVIIGLLATLVLPNLGVTQSRALDDDARRLASDLEFARQRTVMTGIPHRLLLDLEGGAWWIEWEVPEGQAEGGEEAAAEEAPLPDLRSGLEPIDLSPPAAAERFFQPLPSGFGRASQLGPDVTFTAVETPEGRFDRGEVPVAFADDGTAEATAIGLAAGAAGELWLDVLPLADAVQVRDAAG